MYGGGRSLMGPLLVINAVVCLILVGLAAWSLDKYIDGHQTHPHLGGNPSTVFLLVYSLVAGVIGACSLILGCLHLHIWTDLTLATATTSALFSSALTALAFGFVCKQITMGGHRGTRLQTLEAFVAISGLTQLLYLLLLHAGMFTGRFGPPAAYNTANTVASSNLGH